MKRETKEARMEKRRKLAMLYVQDSDNAEKFKRLKVDPAALPIEPEESEQYVEKRLPVLGPLAVLDLEYRMRFGSEADRKDAAKEILDRNGWARSNERVPAASKPMVLVQINQLPWADPNSMKVLEGTTIEKDKARIGDGASVREEQTAASHG